MELDIYEKLYVCHSTGSQKNPEDPTIMSMEHCLFAVLKKNKKTWK